jgi:hypothetical protein
VRATAGKMAAAGGGVLALALGLGLGSAGVAGAATDPNFAFARTAGPFGATWGFPMSGIQITFGNPSHANNTEFRVNGQSFGGGSFSVPAVFGNVYDQSAANATSGFCTGCQTNAVVITVDVVSGPVTSVVAPTNAQVNLNGVTGGNALAADYTFVVSPGTTTGLTSSALAQLYGLAGQITAEVNVIQPSSVLAGEVVNTLNAVAGVLSDPSSYTAPAATPNAQLAPQARLATPNVQVQRFGSMQTSS